MIIGIIGGGTVGHATARAFIEHVGEVRVYDVTAERRTHTLEQIVIAGVCGLDKPNLVFICLPEDKIEVPFLNNMPYGWDRSLNYVIKSTVPIGFTRRLREQYQLPNLVHSPEFLTARCAVTDAQLPARNIIGIPRRVGESAYPFTGGAVNRCAELLEALYSKRFPSIPIYCMESNESEAVKLFQNSFFAVKISFWNECRTLADKLGLHWDRVIAAILTDGRISHSHCLVPGPDGKFGYGGTCLPKDLQMFYELLMDNDLDAAISRAALRRNVLDREQK